MKNFKAFEKYQTIILDRDGVINEVRFDYVKHPNEMIFIDGSVDAINQLLELGLHVVVATNQSGVGRKKFNEVQLKKVENKINKSLIKPIDFFNCMHHPDERCICRKPMPGLLEEIKRQYKAPFIFIGDNITDCEAANAAGIDFWFVETGYGFKHSKRSNKQKNVFKDLAAAASYINSQN